MPDQIGRGHDKGVGGGDGRIDINEISDDNPEKSEVNGQTAAKRRAPEVKRLDEGMQEILHIFALQNSNLLNLRVIVLQ